MATIQSIHAYEIIDSKGMPTIEGRLTLDDGQIVTSSVPANPLQKKDMAVDLRDEDAARFDGKGVTHAVSYINDLIAPKLKGASVYKQYEIDTWLTKADGTRNKSRLGANTLLTISQLLVKGGAAAQKIPVFRYINLLYKNIYKDGIPVEKMPTPIFNMINGGRHANNKLEFQEFLIVPSSSLTFGMAYQKAVEIFVELKKVLEYRNATTSVGEEGGFSPNLTTNLDALEILNETVSQRRMKVGFDFFLGIDMASSYYFKDGFYTIKDKSHPLKKQEYLDFIKHLVDNYSILILEDAFADEDWDGWKKLHELYSANIYIVGDELTRMNKERLTYVAREGSCNSFIIKPNQVGTVTETFELVNIARKNNITHIVAGRSSETNDDFIADLSVGLQSEFVKFGAPTRGERVSKYNRLWQIEREELTAPTKS